MSEKANILFCDQCNKLLQDVPCPHCKGKGFIRKKLILKRKCNICDGRGQVRQCPDENEHERDRLNNFPKHIPNLLGKQPPLDSTNPMSPYNANNPMSPLNPNNPGNINNPGNPLNPNNPINKNPFHSPGRLPGDTSTNAPPPGGGKKK